MKFISLVPARKGSKSIKDKNIKKINGKPLLSYTFDQIRKSQLSIKDTYLVSDDNRAKKIAKEYNVNTDYIRPKSLSKDKTLFCENLFHFYKWLLVKKISFDFLIILQPTSPLRTSKDINKAMNLIKKNTKSLISISESLEHPHESLYIDMDRGNYFLKGKKNLRRQDFAKKSYFLNGAIYIISKSNLKKNIFFNIENTDLCLIPKMSGFDLNDQSDLKIIKKLLKNN